MKSTNKSQTSIAKFEEFFATSYKDDVFEILETYPDNRSLTVDYNTLEVFDPDLADLLIDKPEEVIEAAQITVRELQQTLVGNWKEQQENGKLTAEQIAELKQKSIEITLKKLSEPTLKLLESAKIDVEVMITSAAEAYIDELKWQ